MSSPQDAPRALNAWPTTIQDKIETLAARHAALRAEVHRAQSDEALTRARLMEVLLQALQARCEQEQQARAVAFAHWRGQAAFAQRPARRNRLRRAVEKALVRAGRSALMVAASGLWLSGGREVDAISAYVARGADPSAQPEALLDQAFYVARNPDVAEAGLSPLVHYLLRGGDERRDPNRLFETGYYLGRHGIDLGETGLTPLEHYMRIGGPLGLDPHPLFWTEFYVAQAPDLAGTRETPLGHYLRVGAARGLSPHPLFQPSTYLAQLGGEAVSDPLQHYLAEGSARGLKPHPLFDPAWFASTYPHLAGEEALTAYVRRAPEKLSPGPWLDGQAYAARRGAGFRAELDPLTDYLWGGAWSLAETQPGLHTVAYLAANPELTAAGVTPLEHWASRRSPLS